LETSEAEYRARIIEEHEQQLLWQRVEGEAADGLAELRKPFPPEHIGKLPKPTKAQTDAVKADFKVGIRCNECGGWHHPKAIHLDYVGHAALTSRLLDVDPSWKWEPMATDEYGRPILDNDGLLWIKLTVCGVARVGCGDAGGKTGGDAMKERIGDALRNAGMRFGLALDLWHKGDLNQGDEPVELSDDVIARIKDGADKGATAEQIATRLNISINDVNKELAK